MLATLRLRPESIALQLLAERLRLQVEHLLAELQLLRLYMAAGLAGLVRLHLPYPQHCRPQLQPVHLHLAAPRRLCLCMAADSPVLLSLLLLLQQPLQQRWLLPFLLQPFLPFLRKLCLLLQP